MSPARSRVTHMIHMVPLFLNAPMFVAKVSAVKTHMTKGSVLLLGVLGNTRRVRWALLDGWILLSFGVSVCLAAKLLASWCARHLSNMLFVAKLGSLSRMRLESPVVKRPTTRPQHAKGGTQHARGWSRPAAVRCSSVV